MTENIFCGKLCFVYNIDSVALLYSGHYKWWVVSKEVVGWGHQSVRMLKLLLAQDSHPCDSHLQRNKQQVFDSVLMYQDCLYTSFFVLIFVLINIFTLILPCKWAPMNWVFLKFYYMFYWVILWFNIFLIFIARSEFIQPLLYLFQVTPVVNYYQCSIVFKLVFSPIFSPVCKFIFVFFQIQMWSWLKIQTSSWLDSVFLWVAANLVSSLTLARLSLQLETGLE